MAKKCLCFLICCLGCLWLFFQWVSTFNFMAADTICSDLEPKLGSGMAGSEGPHSSLESQLNLPSRSHTSSFYSPSGLIISISCWGRRPWWTAIHGLQRVGRDWSGLACTRANAFIIYSCGGLHGGPHSPLLPLSRALCSVLWPWTRVQPAIPEPNLGSKITAEDDCSYEIKRCLLLGRSDFGV